MAPVIWGLNLGDMKWSAFKSSNMFRRDYHLRRAKMIVYQIAMILCVVSESVGTDALSHYVDQQTFIENLNGQAQVHNDDFVGIASYNIFVGIYVATIFGAGFFFDLFWPERHESRGVRLAWKICAILACMAALGDALALTVIVATRSAHITGVDAATARALYAQQSSYPPLKYREYGRAVASAVVLWPGWVATVASTIILFMSHKHDDQFGPKSAHTLREEEEAKAGRRGTELSESSVKSSAGPAEYGAGAESTNSPYNQGTAEGEPNFMAEESRETPATNDDSGYGTAPRRADGTNRL